MKKTHLAIFAALVILAFVLPSGTVKAIATPDFNVTFCGTHFYFESEDYPTYIIGYIVVHRPNGTVGGTISLFGSNGETVDVGYTIGSLDVAWGTSSYYIGSFQVTTSNCPSTKLIDMYVYYSDTPWYGNTHTMTIFSAKGFPSKGTLTALAGGTLPAGFVYGVPACWGGLYDDESDKGIFDCDPYLAGVGERRSYLRNDPQGADFDLLPKIANYYKMINGQ